MAECMFVSGLFSIIIGCSTFFTRYETIYSCPVNYNVNYNPEPMCINKIFSNDNGTTIITEKLQTPTESIIFNNDKYITGILFMTLTGLLWIVIPLIMCICSNIRQ